MPTTRNRSRCLLDLANADAPLLDLLQTTPVTPEIPRGFDWQLEIGLAESAALQEAIGHIASITIEVKRPRAGRYAPDADDTLLMAKTLAAVDLNAALTTETWVTAAEADSHALLAFTAAETLNLPAGKCWINIYALTTDAPARRILYASAPAEVDSSGSPSTGDALDPQLTYLTAEQSDARYPLLSPVDANFRIKDGNPLQIRETAPTAGFRTVWLEGGALKFGALDES